MKSFCCMFILLVMFSGCTVLRSIRCGAPSTDTYLDFPLDTVAASDSARKVLISSTHHDRYFEHIRFSGCNLNNESIGEYFSRVRGDGSLLVVRNDTVLLEQYYGKFSHDTRSSIFSLTKAVTALLCGIAIDEGYMSITDPVTKYLPELMDNDFLFHELTIEHLLNMRTGLDFKENYGWNPFSKMAKLYYGKDVAGQFKRLRFKSKPGTSYYYNSMATALLGVIIEKAVGKSYAKYLQEKVWKPLGMENYALVSLDDSKHRHAKAYGGLVSNARDMAKIGRLYINGGIYDGKRIISKAWIDRSTHSSLDNKGYSFGWNNIMTRIDGEDVITPRFFAIGLYGQVLFCDPDHNLIFVTLGEKKGCEYHLLFDSICNMMNK